MGLGIRRKKKLALLILTSSLLVVILFRIHQGYSLFDYFKIAKEDNRSEKVQCLAKLSQNGKSKGASWSNEFYQPSRWKSFVSIITGGRRDRRMLIQSLSSLLLYRQCSTDASINGDVPLLRTVEEKLFPYINFSALNGGTSQEFWPIHTRFDGSTYRGQVLEFSATNNSFTGTSQIEFDYSRPFWESWLNSAIQKGSRGLVISVSDFQVGETVRLIKVLRLLKNTLPIELVHKSDLEEIYQRLLITTARENGSLEYPSQELWFLNVKSLLKDGYAAKFKRFSNKWLAITFSSFQIPILLDSDTVPFVPLDTFYQADEFIRTGTLFFKDRNISNPKLNSRQINTLKQMINHSLGLSLDSEQNFESLKNRLKDDMAIDAIKTLIFKRQKHYMESGLLVLDKLKHFFSLPIAVMLQFSPIQEYFHGDKEWFWLGLLISNDTFTFYPVEASNVGKLKDLSTPESGQVCSVQLSHTDMDGNLLWLNGGLSVCKKVCWEYDFTKNKVIAAKYSSVDELRKYYQSPVTLESAVIPGVGISSWSQQRECVTYNYCTDYKRGDYGTLIEFTDSQKKFYKKIVQLWNEPI
ncbi:mnt4p [Saccharomyces arboricola H-6]|uniref:Mnt4p n=1 Tax=Saccharomyces arboricola (strain H-6 / AS 2.3317 / CBS 10644) TaxID=1160507 RepID=J8PWZ3_SACAR|nr:mnt4p [Saccharomyces arboricola H-6]